jgi:hypothetical protein
VSRSTISPPRRALVALGLLLLSGCRRQDDGRARFSLSAERVDVYDALEIQATTAPVAAGTNPFAEESLTGTFETGDGRRSWQVVGFCDDEQGRVYRIRFMPSEPGSYRYSVTLRRDGAASTSKGTFVAVANGRRGPIRVDSRYPFHFVWEGTGEHYFFNGATAYWLTGWRDERVIEASLERLHRLKINRLRVTIAGRPDRFFGEPVMEGPDWTPYITAWPATHREDLFHPGFDFSRYHLPQWRKFERVLALARQRDMIVSVILDMNDGTVHPAAGSADERRFIRYAVARLSSFSNITWDLGDDLDRYRNEVWAHTTGTWLKVWDPYRHLATSHPIDNRHQDRTADWFDFTSFQEWSRDQHRFMLTERARQERLGRIIPQTNEEYGYEDHYPLWAPRPPAESADALRRMAWEISMAGGYQTTGESARRGTQIWPDTGGGWMNGRGDDTMTMLQGYARMVEFFTSFEWWKLEPHDELIDGGNFCLASPGNLYVVYLPQGRPGTLRLPDGVFEAHWYNPLTGDSIGLDRVNGGRWAIPAPPASGQDWALFARRQR